MSSSICIDASLVIQFVANPRNAPIQAQWAAWDTTGQRFVAPRLLLYEVTNGLHRYAVRGELSPAIVDTALRHVLQIGIDVLVDERDHSAAIEIARRFNRPATYDAHYLALAERLGVDFYTADERLYNAVHRQLRWVRFVG